MDSLLIIISRIQMRPQPKQKKNKMKNLVLYLFILLTPLLRAQETDPGQQPEVLEFEEYLAFVKRFHPVARQADLFISRGEAEMLRARGGFDPKIEVDYARKEFKGTEYYDILNSTFKIPTWYGLEFKANYEQNQGVYLNPERTVPEDGLYSAGVALAVGQGMFMDQRMAALRTARLFREQNRAERDLLVNQVLFDASIAYFEWFRAYNEFSIYEGFVENARIRFEGVRRNALAGEVAAIDTVEAKISLQDRRLQMEQAAVDLMKRRLEVSNFLWLQNNVPVELQPQMVPELTLLDEVDEALSLMEEVPEDFSLENHPKIVSLRMKLRALEIERRLKANNLLPDIDLEYNFLTPQPDEVGTFNTSNYKAGVRVRIPLFLRKERGDLRLAEFKVQDATFDLDMNTRQIENKIEATLRELESYQVQTGMITEMVENYNTLLAAEERKFTFGESSLFLINTREVKLIEAQLKQNEVLTKYLYAKARLFQNLGTNPDISE